MNQNKKNIAIEIIGGLFILLFVYAAASKVLDFQKFRVELGKSPILNSFADMVAYSILAIEIVTAALLMMRRSQFIGLYVAFSLMVMFSIYIAIILSFSTYIPCSCGGVLQNMTWSQHLVFNIAFVLLAAVAILIYPKRTKTLCAL